ncbi:MAG: glycosyltransferase family 1 protein [Crocinitomicaceae bacterium]|nr:glycosyltransferase family 1 protein [Crocinitomicaceae bacterium]MDG1776271.1 glycosyltransferase family 1 protein [Crocinitomicaceae bacterium]
MRIAVNTRFLLASKMEGFGWYTYEVVKRLVEKHPEHDFIFFFDRPFDKKFIFGDNVTPVILNPPARHPFLFYIWFEFSVKRALKKYKADVFLSPDGYLSLKSKVKQIAVIHDINFEHNPDDIPWLMRKYLRRFFPKFAHKAAHILTVSEYSKKDICSKYSIDTSKVSPLWNGASSQFKPLHLDQKNSARLTYANGNPYFLFVGALHPRKNVGRLIAAFEQFKQENPEDQHKLVIVGTEMFGKKLNGIEISPFVRDHILFTGHVSLSDLAEIMGAASLLTYIPYFEGFGIPLVEAMKCGTPILSGNKTSLPEVAGDAAIYCDPFNIDDIREKMSYIVKNPAIQKELSQKGLKRSTLFSWDNTADEIWKVICTIAN